jgi:hypothetical protein
VNMRFAAHRALLAAVVGGSLCAGCASSAPGSGQCIWPADLDAGAYPVNTCSAQRYVLKCTWATNVMAYCLSDDPAECSPPVIQERGAECVNLCHVGQYAAECTDVVIVPSDGRRSSQPSLLEDLPAACVNVAVQPETLYYCCPCQ